MTALNLRRFGAAARQAIAVHCSLAHGGEWAGVSRYLTDDATLIAPDVIGHGLSPDWDGRGDYLRVAAAAVADLVVEPVDLIGHSGGAVIALLVALDRPRLIRTLTLIEPVLFAAARGTPVWDEHQARMAPHRAAISAGHPAASARAFLQVWGDGEGYDGMAPEHRDYVEARMHLIEASEPVLSGDSGSILGPGRLEALDMPVTLLAGMTSPLIIRAIQRALELRLPDAFSALMPDAGHMAPVTHAEMVAAMIAATFRRKEA